MAGGWSTYLLAEGALSSSTSRRVDPVNREAPEPKARACVLLWLESVAGRGMWPDTKGFCSWG